MDQKTRKLGNGDSMKCNVIDAMFNYEDASLHFTREVSCFATIENKIISSTTNQSGGSVEFDFFTIWEFLKAQPKMPEQVFMVHSHPEGFNHMSSIDKNMIYGWCLALYIPIWFTIVTDKDVTTYRCAFDKTTKKFSNDLVKIEEYYGNTPIDLDFMARIVYGMSKSNEISQDDINSIVASMNESMLDWQQIHIWNVWNQNTYMVSSSEECSTLTV